MLGQSSSYLSLSHISMPGSNCDISVMKMSSPVFALLYCNVGDLLPSHAEVLNCSTKIVDGCPTLPVDVQ